MKIFQVFSQIFVLFSSFTLQKLIEEVYLLRIAMKTLIRRNGIILIAEKMLIALLYSIRLQPLPVQVKQGSLPVHREVPARDDMQPRSKFPFGLAM